MEGVTFTLQMQSKAAKSRLEGLVSPDANTSSLSLNTEQASLTSSLELSMPVQGREEQEAHMASSSAVESAQSWVDQFTGQNYDSPTHGELAHGAPQERGSPVSSSGAHLSDSITSAGTSLISGSDGERSGVVSLLDGTSRIVS